ncbi:MAG: Ig-like domain-containing protein, partial [bacterium]|nr:Ig-like domain-containing protein [bacterium]
VVALASYKGNKSASTSISVIVDTESPAVVSAISVSNTEVLLQFSEAVQGDQVDPDGAAENPIAYSIITEITNSNLPVMDAIFWDPDFSTVLLSTFSQANSDYKVTVSGIKDLAGNPIAEPTILVDPSSSYFVGIDPSGNAIVDTDGDGLSDHTELIGWEVNVTNLDGSVESRYVTSDPTLADTDTDALGDSEERNGNMDPRNADTDGDLLTDDEEWNAVFSDPTIQDSDGDGLNDGTEFLFFRTSPLLADTDGDQFPDFDEVSAGNRNPLLSDLPSPRIRVGSVNLQLDTRFSFTNEAGEEVTEENTVESTLVRAEDETFSTSNENSTTNTLEFSQQLESHAEIGVGSGGVTAGGSLTATVGSTQGSERGSTFATDETSGRSSEEAYHDSLTTTTARDISESITREIVDAAIKVDVTIENDNDVPFTISNLELTTQTQNPLNRTQVIPVASMVPENPDLDDVNIGALGDPARGPFVFSTISVFPQQVQELMKNPRGLVVQLANFDITDEAGRNFAFVSQEVLDRTAGITFDLGDGRTESYRVATASAHDRITGIPEGITMEYALSIIGLSRFDVIRDGGDGLADTTASGDDVQVRTGSIEPGVTIITAGDNGVIDSTPAGDDLIEGPDYDIPFLAETIRDGGNGIADTVAVGTDVQVIDELETVFPGQVLVNSGTDGTIETVPAGDDELIPAHRVLTRFRDVELNIDEKRFWILYTSDNRIGIDLNKQVIRAGEQYDFAYVQDKDDDGVWAREEFLHGSSDLLVNTDGCDLIPAPDPCDTLTDNQEIKQGWRVQLRGSTQANLVYPNPVQGDSDRDTLFDDEEQACEIDPRQRDTDLDGLTDWEELTGMLVFDDGTTGPMVSRDPDTDEIVHTIIPYDGISGGLIPHEAIAACNTALGINGFATDPLNDDTDGDLINDAIELELGINPNDAGDGGLFLDDDGDGVPNKTEQEGFLTTVNVVAMTGPFTSNPNNTDSDGDGLPDLLEHFIESNPLSADTDGDAISDFDEYKAGGQACVTQDTGLICKLFSTLSENNFFTFVAKCDAADVCSNTAIEQDLVDFGSQQYGTNLNEADSDFDGLDDLDEITGVSILVNGATLDVTSDPLDTDSDSDGLLDAAERTAGTNPQEADTDGDGRSDLAESILNTDPTFKDKKVLIVVTSITVKDADDEGSINEIEPRWFADISLDGGVNFTQVSSASGEGLGSEATISPTVATLFNGIIRDSATSTVTVRLRGFEDDSGASDNEDFSTETSVFNFASAISEQRTLTQTSDDGNLETVLTITVQ